MGDGVQQNVGPQGGLQLQDNVVRRWHWGRAGDLLSAPVRCKRQQWYLARGFPPAGERRAELLLSFSRDGATVGERCVALCAVAEAPNGEALLGWVQAPEAATHVQVHLPDAAEAGRLRQLLLHPVAERDPKCHPLANVPRWSRYRPPFPIERIVLPESLAVLAERLEGAKVEMLRAPTSLRKLAAKVIGAACIVDGAWVRGLGLTLRDLERVAAASWMIVDLETLAALVTRSGAAATKVITHTSQHEIMSARIEYADVATRGFALEDVLPFATLADEATFRTRVLSASAAWKRYADRSGFATLLSSETPWEARCGDVLSAARPLELGELIATDLPWLAAGRQGRLLAPRLVAHLLRMHLGLPLPDYVQYWQRADDSQVLVRDIGELPRRYPPLRAVRWASRPDGIARLGVTLPAGSGPGAARHLMICTGRMDAHARHDGLAAEPLAIFLKWLVREVREHARWAVRHLDNTSVTWQFDVAGAPKYTLQYESAAGIVPEQPLRVLSLRTGAAAAATFALRGTGHAQVMTVPACTGILGDGSLTFQAELTRHLRRWIEQR